MALPAVRSTASRDPFREFDNLMDSLLGRFADDTTRRWAPPAEVSETEDAYLVEVDLPGVKRGDISIDLAGAELSITGELKERERQGLLRYRTRRVGEFAYQVSLPQDVDGERVEANLVDGVLTVRAPKVEASRPRRIEINGS